MKIVSLLVLAGSSLCHGNAFRGARPRRLEDLTGVFVYAEDDTFQVIEGSGKTNLGNVLANDSADTDISVASFIENGTFLGSLNVKANGDVEYTPLPGFVGTEQFEYTACDTLLVTCDTAIGTIQVVEDPNLPTVLPTAVNDEYKLKEGETLKVSASGILSNDLAPSDSLVVCQSTSVSNGDLKIHNKNGNGGFEYTAPKCFTGDATFKYNACYTSYPDLISNEATVKLTVESGRPSAPAPKDDSFDVFEGETLEVDDDDLLDNDEGGDYLVIDAVEKGSGFEGELKVDHNGGFTYTPTPGKLGTFSLTYKVCQDGWEDCVDCKDAKVTIKVSVNPAKPTSPPSPGSLTYTIKPGDILSENLVDSTTYDKRYTLVFSNFVKVATFDGTLSTNSDGTFDYGNALAGEDVFTFKVCYEEWPDLCANGERTIDTISDAVDVDRRSGVATFYEVRWSGETQGSSCAVEPTLSLTCGGEGVLSLLTLAGVGPDDNAACDNSTALNGTITCANSKTSGVVFVECRDLSSDNTSNRELYAKLHSEPVPCDAGVGSAITTISQSMGIKASCNNTFVKSGMICNGTTLKDASGTAVLCYDTVASSGTTDVAPDDISISSTGVDVCVGDASAFAPPTLQVIGDADDEEDAEGYPLQECQADCDYDEDCAGDLICFQRDGSEPVPGCVGVAEDKSDYCIKPPQELVAVTRSGADSSP